MTDEKKAKLGALAKNLSHGNYDMLVATILDAKFKAEQPTQYEDAKDRWRDWANSRGFIQFWPPMQILTREYHEQNMLVLLWCRQELGDDG